MWKQIFRLEKIKVETIREEMHKNQKINQGKPTFD